MRSVTFNMTNYLIIGGTSGIGKSIGNILISRGNDVYATYHSQPLQSGSDHLYYFPLNVVSGEDLNFDALPETLDGIVYCPGSIDLRPFNRIKPDDFVTDYQLQVVGAIKCIQAVLPKLKKAETASILFFSTVAVSVGLPFHSMVSASKGAIEGLTKALAAELAPKIRVNCIAPSLTDTPLAKGLLNTPEKKEANAQRHPLKRIGRPEDIAELASFLLSDKSSWISGQVFHVDGGMSSIKL